MKKFVYMVVLAAVTTLSIVGCTEQQVKPKGGGGAVSDPTAIK
jgi:hypothetical protein